jgi:RHS repeat-associated protein
MDTPAGEFSWDYYDRGLPRNLHYPNGTLTHMEFDNAGRVETIAHTRGAAPIAAFGYHYDANGNRDTITDTAGPHNYGYDEINQLTDADHPDSQLSFNPDEFYNYDGVGNRETTHLSTTHVVNELNQLLEDDSYKYTWDLDGNLGTKTEKANAANVTIYTFNTENRLVRVDLPDSTTVTFTYDITGRRIARTVNNTRTAYAYIGNDLAVEYDAANNPAILYTYGPGIDNILAATRNVAHYYYHKDALQSVYAISDATGAIAHEYKYDSFGNIVVSNGSCSWNTVTYTGRELDDELSLFFYRFRIYDSQSGVFISEDPILQNNLYSYVTNQPLSFVDPFGLRADDGGGAPIYGPSKAVHDFYTKTIPNTFSVIGVNVRRRRAINYVQSIDYETAQLVVAEYKAMQKNMKFTSNICCTSGKDEIDPCKNTHVKIQGQKIQGQIPY